MSKTMNKTLQTIEVLNIVAFLEDIARTGKIDELSIKARWAIKKSSKELIEIDTKFKEFKDELESGLKNDYFMNDAKSESTKIIQKDENGQVVFSDDGNQIIIQDGKVEECNKALNDLQELTVEIDNCNLTIDDFGDDIQCTPEELEALMPFLS